MIFLTRFDGTEVVVNSDLIVTVEKIPDTVVTLTTGDRIMVKEAVDEVVARAATYRHRVMQGPGVRADAHDLAVSLAAGSGPIFTQHRADAAPRPITAVEDTGQGQGSGRSSGPGSGSVGNGPSTTATERDPDDDSFRKGP